MSAIIALFTFGVKVVAALFVGMFVIGTLTFLQLSMSFWRIFTFGTPKYFSIQYTLDEYF